MSDHLPVLKTYKLYIGGKFPRTESGRYFPVYDKKEKLLANMCRGSRKDFREAVVSARAAFPGWTGRTAYNRGQILYRIAEMMEGRRDQLVSELKSQGVKSNIAEREVTDSVDRFVYYAGWADKFQQIFSSVNPVATSHFNFSMPEPTGVVSVMAPDEPSLLSLATIVSAVIVGGNTAIVLASETKPLTAITLAEILNTSDLPGGVVNILTGYREELMGHFSSHMDVNAFWYASNDPDNKKKIQENAAENLKRVNFMSFKTWRKDEVESPYVIEPFLETKTTWHPVGY